jgi:hypothetical protein
MNQDQASHDQKHPTEVRQESSGVPTPPPADPLDLEDERLRTEAHELIAKCIEEERKVHPDISPEALERYAATLKSMVDAPLGATGAVSSWSSSTSRSPALSGRPAFLDQSQIGWCGSDERA